jgi:hypothetical protein
MTTSYTVSPFSGTGSFRKSSSGSTSVSRVVNSTSNVFSSTQPLTISFWYKSLVVSPSFAPIFQSQNSGGFATSFRINTTGTSLGIQFGSNILNTPTALPAGITNISDATNWYHVIISLSGTTISFFFNNVIAGTSITYSNFVAGTYNASSIGTDWNNIDNNGNAKFQLDDLRFYKRTLTALERTALYNFRD